MVGVVWIKLGGIVMCIVLLIVIVVLAGLASSICGHLGILVRTEECAMKGGTLLRSNVVIGATMPQLWVNLDKQPSAGAPLQQYVGPSNNGWGHCKRDWNALIHLFHWAKAKGGHLWKHVSSDSFRGEF